MAVMSKLSIRARNVDSNKSLPIIRSEDLPDVDEFSILPRNAVLLSSGMEKEEEEVSNGFFPNFSSVNMADKSSEKCQVMLNMILSTMSTEHAHYHPLSFVSHPL